MPHKQGYDYKNMKTSEGGYYRPMDSYSKKGKSGKGNSGNYKKSGY